MVNDIITSLPRDLPGGRAEDEVANHHAAITRLARAMQDAMTEPGDQMRVRPSWRTVPAALVAAAGAAAEEIRHDLDADMKRAECKRRTDAAAAWREWVNDGVDAGASRAHAYSRLPVGWTPTMVQTSGGEISCAPDELLAAQRDKYKMIWRPADAPFRYTWGTDEELPIIKVEELRDASKTFPWRTTQTYDGYHPRQVANLSDAALHTLATLLQAVEVAGVWPRQVSLVVTALLPKPRGGFRPIGIAAAVYRVWAKTRRAASDRWEQAHPRSYFSAARGNGPVDTMWRLGARQEEGTADGLEAAVAAEDIQSFFEVIDRARLVNEARAVGYPIPLLRAALAAYSAARVLTLQGRIAREVYPTAGIIAGCSLAMALTKVYCVRAFDAFTAKLPPSVSFDAHVDDLTLGATGAPNAVMDDIITAHGDMAEMVREELGCAFAAGKTAVTATTRAVAASLARRLGVEGGIAGSPCLLGIDSTAGAPRGRLRTKSKKSERLKMALARRKRLSGLRAAIGRKAVRIFRAGAQPAAAFDSAVWGLADAEVQALRKLAAATMSPKARGRSLALVHLWHGMPTAAAEHAPVLQYARMVWKAVTSRGDAIRRGSALTDIRRMHEAARASFQPLVDEYAEAMAGATTAPAAVARKVWAQSRGPMAAAALTLTRIGWTFKSAFELIDDRGAVTVLTRTSPALLADLLMASLTRVVERRVASSWAAVDKSFEGRRVCTDLATAAAKQGRKYTPLQAARFRAAACGAIMTRQKAKDRGYDTDGLCPLCAAAPDTEAHRTYGCAFTEAAVKAAVLGWFWREAQRKAATGLFWVTACFPHPADLLPLPRDDAVCEVERLRPSAAEDGLTDIGGFVYVDGSSTAHAIKDLARAGCAVVEADDVGEPIKVLRMPIPRHMPQTSQSSEYWGMALVYNCVRRAAHVFGDCLNVVRAASGVTKDALAPQRKYAGLVLNMVADPGARKLVQAVKWTKAHRTATGSECRDTARDIRGNAVADIAAREAAKLHPSFGAEAEADIAYYERRAPLVVAAVTAALELFPKAERGMARLPKPADEHQARERRCHYWVHVAGAWRCTLCNAYATASSVPAYRRRQRCRGHPPEDDAEAYAAHGHKVCKAEAPLAIVFCSHCGAWGNKRVKRLKTSCGQPTRAGEQALRRIAAGWHPLLQKDRSGNDLPRMRVRVTAAYDHGMRCWRELAEGTPPPPPPFTQPAPRPPPFGRMDDGDSDHDMDDRMPDDVDQPVWDSDMGGRHPRGHSDSEEDVFGHGGGLDPDPVDQPLQGTVGVAAEPGPHEDTPAAQLNEGTEALGGGGGRAQGGKRARDDDHQPAASRRRVSDVRVAQPRDFVAEAVKRLGDSLRHSPNTAEERMRCLRHRVAVKHAEARTRSTVDHDVQTQAHWPGQHAARAEAPQHLQQQHCEQQRGPPPAAGASSHSMGLHQQQSHLRARQSQGQSVTAHVDPAQGPRGRGDGASNSLVSGSSTPLFRPSGEGNWISTRDEGARGGAHALRPGRQPGRDHDGERRGSGEGSVAAQGRVPPRRPRDAEGPRGGGRAGADYTAVADVVQPPRGIDGRASASVVAKRCPANRAELVAMLREGRARPRGEDYHAVPTAGEPAAAPSGGRCNERACGQSQGSGVNSGGPHAGAAGDAVRDELHKDYRRSRAAAHRVHGGEDILSDFDAAAMAAPATEDRLPKRRRIRGKQPPRQPADEGGLVGPARVHVDSMGASPSPAVLLSVPAVGGRGTAIGACDDACNAAAPLLDSAYVAVASACPQPLGDLPRPLRRSDAADSGRPPEGRPACGGPA